MCNQQTRLSFGRKEEEVERDYMKVNKWVVWSSVVLMTICVVVLCVIDNQTVFANIAIGLFTGSIVSLMTGVINYFIERQKIIDSIKSTLSDTYLNLSLIHRLTGDLLPLIPYTAQLDGLNFGKIFSLSALNIDFAQKCNVESYSGFTKKGKAATFVQRFADLTKELYNLKSCLGNLQVAVLKADVLQNQLIWKQSTQQLIMDSENKELIDRRNLVIVQSSKVHEYEASLLVKLNEIALYYYGKRHGLWDDIKKQLNQQVDKMVKEAA